MLPSLKWLEDPEVFQVNRLNAHSDHVTYANAGEYAAGKTSLRQSLDGTWRFHWSEKPAARPENFWQEGYDDGWFDEIQVPGHMETQGYDRIQYINKLYDWDGHAQLLPPQIDWDFDPVGSYVTCFDLEPGLRGKPVCISFQGVEQAMYLWLNGTFIGYSEDSFTPSEFDLTPYIRETGNRLCVEVYKRSSAAWLEDQDFFSFSGIFRSVYLYARPAVDVEDLWLKTSLDEDNTTGQLTVRLEMNHQASVRLTVTHPQDGVCYSGELELQEHSGYLYSQNLTLPDIHLWDYGCPQLYQALLEVEGGGVIPYAIGFRRVEIRGNQLLLNGKKLLLNGVNRHEWSPTGGRCITREDMDKAMEMFHANHINAVRTCHYPDRTEWYHMCDQNGIYVMDEANLETHGSWQRDMAVDASWNVPGSLPQWERCVVDRANSMFQRDKNHVSILFWSCGNESYAGTCIAAMADFLRREDPSRPVHYEGVYWCREFDYISDVESRMYATPGEIREYLEKDGKKPYLNCEYMHNMGNSLGGMESYVRLEQEFANYHGGFIWDYMDQALWQDVPGVGRVLGYGGDFGERQSDYAFSANGIVTADGCEKPCMQEVRYWYLPEQQRKRWDEDNARAAASVQPVRLPGYTQELRITNGDGAWGVRGEKFEILFSKLAGGPVSVVVGGQEWLWRSPRPAFWRAPTENDQGCGFPQKSAIWNAVEAWQTCTGWEVTQNTPEAFAICYTYGAAVMPGLETRVEYRVSREGAMTVTAEYTGAAGRPQLPLFGLRFATPAPVEQTQWVGLSGETYPDRFKGAAFGTHRETPHVPNYLVPQECGNHAQTHSASFTVGGAKLTVEKTHTPFHFSAVPYTPGQLQEAQHTYELPVPTRTVITLCSAMRGVGGIDTWMTDVEPAYHISAEQSHTLQVRFIL